MAQTNFPEELTALVEEYLTDGIISAKERQVLLKKAQALGVDVDEFDLYIDAQQQKVDQQVDAAASKKRGKTCPFCGAPIPQLTDKCPECGQFITPEASEELKEILEKLEDALVDFKSGRDINRAKAKVERYARKAQMYYSNNPKIKPLLASIEAEVAIAEKKAKALQRSGAFVKVITNPWTWVIVEIIITVVSCCSIGMINDDDTLICLTVFLLGICAVVGTIIYAVKRNQ